MKPLILIGLCFFTIVLAQRPTLTLEPLDWSISPTVEVYSTFILADADLFYSIDQSAPTYTSVLIIRRRNSNGDYEHFANFTTKRYPVNSNGKWMALANQGVTLFKINENNISDISDLDTVDFGYILSDDTFVGYDPIPTNDGNYTIRTFEYNESNNSWINIPGTELTINKQAAIMDGKVSNLKVTDNSLLIWGATNVTNVTVDIYDRQADKSWRYVESVPTSTLVIQIGQFAQLAYNGVDSFVITILGQKSSNSSIGVIFIYTKINGKWIEQFITPEDIGYRPLALFGMWVVYSDPNTMFVSAGLEGVTFGQNAPPIQNDTGKVLMLTRNAEGTWIPTRDLIGGPVFGTGLAMNDYDLFVTAGYIPATVYTIPTCTFQPINVTCNDMQANDCSEVPVTELYTIHNARCGDVTATVNSLSLSDNHVLHAQVQFDRQFATTTYCNATVTCPAPPVTIQTVTPTTRVSSAVAHQLLNSFVMTCLLVVIIM